MLGDEQVNTNGASQSINKPTKQHLVNWICEANEKLDSNPTIVKKSFLVTGISNVTGSG